MTGKGKFPNETCSAQIPTDGVWGHTHACERPVTTHEEGKPWCTIHAPSYEAKRRIEREAKWEAKWAGIRAQDARVHRNQARLALFDELVKALKAYQQANHIHNDSEATLYEQAEPLLAQAEAIEKGAKG